MDATMSRPEQGLRAAIVIAAAGSAGAGLIHAAAAGSHSGSRTLVWMFAGCAAAQLGWAAAVVLVPKRLVLLAGVVINSAALGAWFLSRTVGISFVDALVEPEAIGTQDLLAAMLAAVALGGAVLAIAQPISRRAIPNAWSAAIVFGVVVLAVPALAAGHTHSHDEAAGGEHIHAVGAAAHSDEGGDGHDHDTEVAGITEEHGHDDDDHATDGTTSTTHGHGATTVSTPQHDDTDHPHSNPPPAGNPTQPTGHDPNHPHGTPPPTTPGVTTPPHNHPPPPPTGPIVTVTDPRLSATQQKAAGNLLLSTLQAMTAFPTVAAVQAAGYQSIGDSSTGFEHFVNWTYFSDGSELNPQRIESIVATRQPERHPHRRVGHVHPVAGKDDGERSGDRRIADHLA